MKTIRESVILRQPAVKLFFHYASSLRLTLIAYIADYVFCMMVFMIMERGNFVDALWFCTVTWFTVGYGDMVPTTDIGKLFTIYAIISSHILIILLTANFVNKLAHVRAYYNRQEERDALDSEEEVDVAAIIS